MFTFLNRQVLLRVFHTSDGRGIVMNPSESDHVHEGLERVLVHWANLPPIPLTEMLRQSFEDGGSVEWSGRHVLQLGSWKCRIDARPNLAEVFRSAKTDYLSVNTHLMEVRRADGALFSSSEVAAFLVGLQFGMSFALSRWTAPVLPVGFTDRGEAVWSSWASWHIDPPMMGSGRWWVSHRPQDLWSFLEVWVSRWDVADERHHLSFLVSSALAAGEGVFVEQRLMTSLAAIEKLSWITEVSCDVLTEETWRRKGAPWRIRRMLRRARIPIEISTERTPLLAQYANDFQLCDGAKVIAEIRDRLTHPKRTEDLYDRPGLLAEASRLARKYLDLLLLHYVGYEGQVSDRTRVHGWEGESELVPWRLGPSQPSSSTGNSATES